MRIDFRRATRLALLGAAGACAHFAARPAVDPPPFRGIFEMRPDRSAFRLCGSEEEWYVDPSSAPAWMELERRTRMVNEPPRGMVTAQSAGTQGFQRAYVEVQGDTMALTAGPEVGRYARELRPTRVLVARPAPRAHCP